MAQVAAIFPAELIMKILYDGIFLSYPYFFKATFFMASYITKLIIGLIIKIKFGIIPLKNASIPSLLYISFISYIVFPKLSFFLLIASLVFIIHKGFVKIELIAPASAVIILISKFENVLLFSNEQNLFLIKRYHQKYVPLDITTANKDEFRPL